MVSTLSFLLLLTSSLSSAFEFEEANIAGIQAAFKDGRLTSRQLTEHYLERIKAANPRLHAVVEVSPDALTDAARADEERASGGVHGPLHGIPVLVKDNIATRDRLNTTACSFALLGSVVPRDAGVIRRLRLAGGIVLGKASMSEWAHFRSVKMPNGWCARAGQGRNPYSLSASPCGSSCGSAVAVAANLATVSIGTETDGSILCPAAMNSVVGIKPTIGITSRAGTVPISPRQDTVGPMGRTVADAVALLDVIAGYDPLDAAATSAAARFIPRGGFQQFLKSDGLNGKRVGILHGFFNYAQGSIHATTFAAHFETMRRGGATLVDDLELSNATSILNQIKNGELTELMSNFKLSLNSYLEQLVSSPVRSLRDVIEFNNNHRMQEGMKEFGQDILTASELTNGISSGVLAARSTMDELSKKGMEELVIENRLDAIVFPDALASHALAIGGFPAISVPAGYSEYGVPFALCFGGLKGSDRKLIEIAYSFEQATSSRLPPTFV